jgi:hypothetical protein
MDEALDQVAGFMRPFLAKSLSRHSQHPLRAEPAGKYPASKQPG